MGPDQSNRTGDATIFGRSYGSLGAPPLGTKPAARRLTTDSPQGMTARGHATAAAMVSTLMIWKEKFQVGGSGEVKRKKRVYVCGLGQIGKSAQELAGLLGRGDWAVVCPSVRG